MTNFSHLVTPPRQQRDVGWKNSCAGMAVAYALSILHALSFKGERMDFDPNYSWNAAKWLMQPRGVGDCQTHGDEVSLGVEMFGGLPSHLSRSAWRQYSDCEPTTWEVVAASKYKTKRWKVAPRNDGMVHGPSIRKELSDFWMLAVPVIFNVKCDDGFMGLRDQVWKPSGKPIRFGHYVCATEINHEEQWIRIINSWGPEWGQGGFGRISLDAFNDLTCSDAWAFSKFES